MDIFYFLHFHSCPNFHESACHNPLLPTHNFFNYPISSLSLSSALLCFNEVQLPYFNVLLAPFPKSDCPCQFQSLSSSSFWSSPSFHRISNLHRDLKSAFTLRAHTQSVCGLQVCGDSSSNKLYSCSWDHSLKEWDIEVTAWMQYYPNHGFSLFHFLPSSIYPSTHLSIYLSVYLPMHYCLCISVMSHFCAINMTCHTHNIIFHEISASYLSSYENSICDDSDSFI